MNDELEQVLWGLWQKRQSDEWVFVNPKTRTRWGYRYKLLRGICKRAGVPHFGYHAIRHFVASYLFDKKKVSLPVISKLLRHKNLQTTERYLQAIDQRFRDTMKLLEGEFFGSTYSPTYSPGLEGFKNFDGEPASLLVAGPRIELGTRGFSVRCSTG
jgi:hypothetical protein